MAGPVVPNVQPGAKAGDGSRLPTGYLTQAEHDALMRGEAPAAPVEDPPREPGPPRGKGPKRDR